MPVPSAAPTPSGDHYSSLIGEGGGSPMHGHCGNLARKRNRRSDREIEATDDDYESLAARHNCEKGRVSKDVRQVCGPREPRVDDAHPNDQKQEEDR